MSLSGPLVPRAIIRLTVARVNHPLSPPETRSLLRTEVCLAGFLVSVLTQGLTQKAFSALRNHSKRWPPEKAGVSHRHSSVMEDVLGTGSQDFL